jgi:hypothetical protein
MASQTPNANPESTWRLYSALAVAAGVRRAVRVDDPRVLAGVVRGSSGDLALLVNSSDATVEIDPVVEEGAELALEGGLELGPFEVTTLQVSRADEPLLGIAGSPVSRFRGNTDGAADHPLDTPAEGSDATA